MSNLTLLRENVAAVDILYADVGGIDLEAVADPDQATRRGSFERAVKIENVSFAYDDGTPALRDVNLIIDKGQSVAFVGRSGSGKTTLANLVLGLIEPTDGRIMVDGRPLGELGPAWQRLIGYVPQDVYLTDDTLRRNIAFGVDDAAIDDAAVNRAVEIAQLAPFVASLPDGVATVVGERGDRLSGGQRQRIGIARALYRDPEVIVFDEATSALDHETEHEISLAIEGMRARGKTVILIAHRLSTVRNCEMIVFVKDGRIADRGRFGELVERDAEFRRMTELADGENAAATERA